MLPDAIGLTPFLANEARLNAPTGAWYSLTYGSEGSRFNSAESQSQCTYRCVVLPDFFMLNIMAKYAMRSQCTYRCVVLPDKREITGLRKDVVVSMHLQVRGAP